MIKFLINSKVLTTFRLAYLSTDLTSPAATASLNFDLTRCLSSCSFFLSSLKELPSKGGKGYVNSWALSASGHSTSRGVNTMSAISNTKATQQMILWLLVCVAHMLARSAH